MCLAVSFTIAVQPIKVHHSLTMGNYCKSAIIGPKLLTLFFFWYHIYLWFPFLSSMGCHLWLCFHWHSALHSSIHNEIAYLQHPALTMEWIHRVYQLWHISLKGQHRTTCSSPVLLAIAHHHLQQGMIVDSGSNSHFSRLSTYIRPVHFACDSAHVICRAPA